MAIGAVIAGIGIWTPWQAAVDNVLASSGIDRFRGAAYSVKYPDAWERHESKDAQGNTAVEINGPATEDGAYSGQVRILTWQNWSSEFQDKLTQVRAASAQSGYQIVGDSPVTVRGADRAHRFTVRYTDRTVIGKSVRLSETRTLVLTRERLLIDFSVRGPDDAGSRQELEPVVESFRLR